MSETPERSSSRQTSRQVRWPPGLPDVRRTWTLVGGEASFNLFHEAITGPWKKRGENVFSQKKDGKDPKAEEKPLTEDKRNIFVFQPETPSGRIDIRRERNHIFRPKWNTKKEKIFKR